MKCSNCNNILITSLRCPYCPNLFCSLSCLESHYAVNHNLNLFHKNDSENNLYFQHSTTINSIFLVKGVLNSEINYNPLYNINNFIPVYIQGGQLKIIGSGSYGQVYLGQNIIDKNYYAIKHMNKTKILSILTSLSNIQKEIEIQSKIDHPNIVKLLYVKENETSFDLIMEYAPGGNLFHYIRKNRCLSENQSFSIFIQVVNAITFLHENDLIHRDIKPENILIFNNNVVKLCDFGWCVKLNGYQRGTFCGTTEYMSPELVNHQGYGKEIDTWSLGVLLYEMIHGYSPFKPNKLEFEPEDVMENIINHNLNFKKQVSDRCKKLIYGLLDSNINNRYTVEDIFNSEFVKYYENIEKNRIKYNNYNYSFEKEKPKKARINNILYSPQIKMNNNINIHMSMDYNNYIYNIQIPNERNNSYDFMQNSQNEQKINIKTVNKGLYENYIKNAKISNSGVFNNSRFEENVDYISDNNINDNNIYNNNSFNNLFNLTNLSYDVNENEYRRKMLSFDKTDTNFYLNEHIKQKQQPKLLDLYSSYKRQINNHNVIEKELFSRNKEKEKINSNNNYFYEAKNYILNKSQNNKLNNNIVDSHILKISSLSNSQFNNDINEDSENINYKIYKKDTNQNYLDNYLYNNHYLNNNRGVHNKISLIKRTPLNNKSIDLNTNLSLSSYKTSGQYFSEIKNQNMDSIIFNNNRNMNTPNKSNLEIENLKSLSYIKIPEKIRLISDSYNNNKKYVSKSEISELTKIEDFVEKEPIDNIKKKNPLNEGEIRDNEIKKHINLNNNFSIRLIKQNRKIGKTKEISKSNINILKKINFDQPKEVELTESINQDNNYNLNQQKTQSENYEIFNNINQKNNNILTEINKKADGIKDQIPKDKKIISKYIYKPKNDIEIKSKKIYYKTEIKNNINNTKESSNLNLSNNKSIYNILDEKIREIHEPNKLNNNISFNLYEGKNNIKSKISNNIITKIRKKNIIKKVEEKRPRNNKKNHIKTDNISPKSIDKIVGNDKHIISLGTNNLLNSHSDNNIIKITKIDNLTNHKINNIKLKDGTTYINNTNYIDNKLKEKQKSDIIKKGIKKIYIYNNQIKNFNEKEKYKNLNFNNNKSRNGIKPEIKDRSYDSRNIKKGVLNYKKNLNQINKNEYNIVNNISNLNDKNEERNKTPEKISIFNPVKPNILIESFRKELENKTNMIKFKYNIVKK